MVIAIVSLLLLVGGGLSPVLSEANTSIEAGPPVRIGSKPFTEQYILAHFIADNVEEANMEVDLRSSMGTMVLYEALANGSIDCYVDYTGTIWSNVMKRNDLLSRTMMLDTISTWLEKQYGIVNLGALGFENTYGLAVRQQDAERHGWHTIDDLTSVAPELLIGSDYEFFSRPEWTALQKAYHLDFQQQVTMDPVLMYSAVSQGDVDVISAYSTDGRIVAYDLTILIDTKQALPPYDAVLLLSAEAAKRNDLVSALREVIGKIDDNVMRQANKLVDLDGSSVDSAAAYLQHQMKGNNMREGIQ
jgi:osmoprotectant transport system permease protein